MQIEKMKVSDLKYAPYNPRKIDDKELAKLKRSISEFGYVEPIVWNERTGFVVGGNQRLKVLRELGIEEVDVVVVDLDDAKEKALNVALNKISGEWDFPKLKDLLIDIDTGDFDIELTGFDLDEIGELIAFDKEPEEDGFDVDAALENTEEPVTKRGDIYLLGKHRLMCGDSTIKEDVEKLMDGKKADMVFTDPPYGVAVNSGDLEDLKARNRRLDGKKVTNDHLKGEELRGLLEKSFNRFFENMKTGASIYVCHAEGLGMDVLFRSLFAEAGFKPAEIIIWVKDVFAFGRQDYHWRHEPIIYGWKEGAAHYFVDDRTQDTVWEIARPKISKEHPTMKPIALCSKAINNSSKSGWIVLDLFGGSGSTLIACEQLNRICYMMELDERYCDVIVKRWEEYTGEKAKLIRK